MTKGIFSVLLLVPAMAIAASADMLGASTDVKGSVPDVSAQTKAVFKQMGITQTTDNIQSPQFEETLNGVKGGTKVEVHIKQSAANATHVDVTAQQGTLKWNKDYAQSILNHIIQKTG